MNKIRIIPCDDHAVVRAGLAAILGYEDDIEVVGEAADGLQAVALERRLKPDVAVMDMRMPGLSGTEVTAALRQAAPRVRVLLLTSYVSQAEVWRALDEGASDT